MRAVIKCNQRPSEAITGRQRHSGAIKGHFGAIMRNHAQSCAIRGTHLPSHLTRSKLHGLSRRLEHARLLVRRLRLGLPDRLCHCRLLLRLGTHCRLPQQLLDLNLRRSRWQPEAITGANTGAISGNHRRHQRGQLRSAPVAPPPPSLMREAISMQSQAPSACNQLHLLLRRRLL